LKNFLTANYFTTFLNPKCGLGIFKVIPVTSPRFLNNSRALDLIFVLYTAKYKKSSIPLCVEEFCPELEFLKSLWGLGTEEEEGYRTGPPGYIGWRNSFLGIDFGAPYTFKNTGSVKNSMPAFLFYQFILSYNIYSMYKLYKLNFFKCAKN
jgi:hypothetical protein